MKVILTGATGFTGSEVLKRALADESIEQVAVLTRRPVGFTHTKLREVVRKDFLDYSGLQLANYDACIWCLGVSQTQVGEKEYIEITFDYAVAAATAMYAANPKLRFCFVSGRSADPDEGNGALYSRIKGRTERALSKLSENVFNFRPGYIRASAQSVKRRDLGRFFAPISTIIDLFTDGYSVDCDQLARCLLNVAKDGANVNLLDNRTIRSWKYH